METATFIPIVLPAGQVLSNVVTGAHRCLRNSRIKDFFDIDYLARTERLDGAMLVEAVRRTFARRGTPIPVGPPIGLTAELWSQPGRDAQVRAFARRARLEATVASASELGRRVAEFATPVLKAALQTDRERTSAG
jgi:hypothetical protein